MHTHTNTLDLIHSQSLIDSQWGAGPPGVIRAGSLITMEIIFLSFFFFCSATTKRKIIEISVSHMTQIWMTLNSWISNFFFDSHKHVCDDTLSSFGKWMESSPVGKRLDHWDPVMWSDGPQLSKPVENEASATGPTRPPHCSSTDGTERMLVLQGLFGRSRDQPHFLLDCQMVGGIKMLITLLWPSSVSSMISADQQRALHHTMA